MVGVLGYVALDAIDADAFANVEDNVIVDRDGGAIAATTTAISDGYLGSYLVPLIALSFVLLAAAIGAIVLARKD
jgi:NADH-quinone oxidoreductase subunit J